MSVTYEQVVRAYEILEEEGMRASTCAIADILDTTDYVAISRHLSQIRSNRTPETSVQVTPEFANAIRDIMQGIADRTAKHQAELYSSKLQTLQRENAMLREFIHKAGHWLETFGIENDRIRKTVPSGNSIILERHRMPMRGDA